MWLFFSAYSLRFIVGWWMALADDVLWTYPRHLPRRPSDGAAGKQETASSLSKHHSESIFLVSWSTQGAGEEKPHPTWSLSPLTHVVREPWPTAVQTRAHYLWSIYRCLSTARSCHQSEVLSCLTLPSALLPSEESPGRGLGGNRQSQDLPLSAPFCQNVVKQQGSIFHSTQLSIFFGDERFSWVYPDPMMNSWRRAACLPDTVDIDMIEKYTSVFSQATVICRLLVCFWLSLSNW